MYVTLLCMFAGVYQRKSNQVLGGHAVKFLGWGTEDGLPYW